MNANPILLQKKYSRVIECFAKQQGISLDAALDFFYHSGTYQLMRDGISDMHCMSELYLAEELKEEYDSKTCDLPVTREKTVAETSFLCGFRGKGESSNPLTHVI